MLRNVYRYALHWPERHDASVRHRLPSALAGAASEVGHRRAAPHSLLWRHGLLVTRTVERAGEVQSRPVGQPGTAPTGVQRRRPRRTAARKMAAAAAEG